MRCIFVSVLSLALFVFGEELEVKISNGNIRGTYMESRNGRKFRAFTGIPYAKAPVGELRFEHPAPPDNWNDVKDTTKPHDWCIQFDIFQQKLVGSEDCLYLNVYTPAKSNSDQLSVMVWIHGGGFVIGSGSINHYEPNFFMDKDVVLVSINYRLGPLGFLTTGDEVIPGNIGLKDQVFALKWIQENIAAFGGNPNSVAVFGESAGGASTHHLLLTPLTKGLIHSAISQSGTATCTWAVQTRDEAVKLAKKMAAIFDCPTSSSREIADCLKKVSATDIIETRKQFYVWDTNPMIVFKPVVEEESATSFLNDHPYRLIEQGKVLDVPWMVGLNTHEGAILQALMALNPKAMTILEEDLETNFPATCHVEKEVFAKIIPHLRKFYLKGRKMSEVESEAITNLFTDTMFLSCIDQSVTAHRQHLKQPIYQYLFEYRGSKSMTGFFGIKEDLGVSHGDDLYYLFPLEIFSRGPPNETDIKMSEEMLTLWTNFATYGNPTLSTDDKVQWNPVTSKNNEYLKIMGPDDMKMSNNMIKERVDFWRSLKVQKDSYHLYRDEL